MALYAGRPPQSIVGHRKRPGGDGVEERVLLRPEEVATRLGIGRSVVYELIGTGELESILIGRSRRVPVRALEAFVDKQRQHQAVAT